MNEILPGVFHWKAKHERIGTEVSSYFIAESGTLLDPMVPAEGLEWFGEGREPQVIALTNRHHDRQAAQFCTRFGLGPLLVPESGLHEFEDKELPVSGYAIGEELIPGIVCHEVDSICPDDMALEIRSAGALAVADGIVSYDGIRFVPDHLMDDPEDTKRGLAAAYEALLDEDFDTLLFAHGDPIVGGGKQALREFLASNPAA